MQKDIDPEAHEITLTISSKELDKPSLERLNDYEQVRTELKAQYLELRNVLITHGMNAPSTGTPTAGKLPREDDALIVYMETKGTLSQATKKWIRNWLMAHYKLENVYVFSKKI